MVKAVTFATLILACLLLVEAAPATTRINEIRSMCSYYTGKISYFILEIPFFSWLTTILYVHRDNFNFMGQVNNKELLDLCTVLLLLIMRVYMYISGDGKYADGTNQNDIQLLWNFIQICKNYGGYEGTTN